MTNPRNYIKQYDNSLIIDENLLDLNYIPEIIPPAWQPTLTMPDFENTPKLYLDIETTGLDAEHCRVIMIGVKIWDKVTILNHADEAIILRNFIKGFNDKAQSKLILVGHNIFKFDLPFLIKRCAKYGIEHNFKFGNRERTISASSYHGRPITFLPIYHKNVDIIDTMQQVCIWDKSQSKLISYGLKSATIALGQREKKRLELSNEQIQACYQNGDLATIATYLEYDLEDTELLYNFLIPVIYFQFQIVPDLLLQEMAIASPALKAQKIHEQLLGTGTKADEQHHYDGGRVSIHTPGLYRNVAKIDVSSLYPSIMLKYGLCSSKDPEHRFLGVLQYMTQARLKLKKELKKYDENTPEYNEINHNQNALKILINGSYGFFGTGGYSYNDYYAAALVTAYGRKILRLMEDVIMGMGGNLIESDTDGVIFQSENPERIYKRICERLPEGIKTDLELQGCVAYVPKAKNYIILPPVGDPKHKGSKRSDIPLLNQFKIGYIQAWKNSQQAADQYYLDVIDSLNSGAHPIADLTITRKISKSEKHLVNLGIGQPGDIVSYYYGSVGGKPLEVTQGSPYHPGYYIKKIQAFLNEVDARYDNAQLSLVV